MQNKMGQKEKRVEIELGGVIFLIGELHQNEYADEGIHFWEYSSVR